MGWENIVLIIALILGGYFIYRVYHYEIGKAELAKDKDGRVYVKKKAEFIKVFDE
jgi:hypothetical protein